ncbi:MAG: lamin tail domain-containing protein [Bacteroidales bacterium]
MRNLYLFLFILNLFTLPAIYAQENSSIKISEIMYNPPGTIDSLEFIELYNSSNTEFNMEGCYFDSGISYTFPKVIIQPKNFLVIAKDANKFAQTFNIQALQWNEGSLANEGEKLSIKNSKDEIINKIEYKNDIPWNPKADGKGSSLILTNLESDNRFALNWEACTFEKAKNNNEEKIYCTPGSTEKQEIKAFFKSKVKCITKGRDIKFYNFSSGKATKYLWEFEGGSPSTSNQKHPKEITYNTPGIYSIKLTTKGEKADSYLKEEYIEVLDTPSPIIFSEILYNPPGKTEELEFIELYNNSENDIQMEGYHFTKGIDFIFPKFILKKKSVIVIAKNTDQLKHYFPKLLCFQFTKGNLKNEGEDIQLKDAQGKTIAYIYYDNKSPWDKLADGKGHSIQICNPNLPNDAPSSWKATINYSIKINEENILYASPGSFCKTTDIKEKTNTDNSIRIFPNPSKGLVFIENNNKRELDINIFSIKGRLLFKKTINKDSQLTINNLNPGIYILRTSIDNNSQIIHKKIIIE